MGSAYGGSRPLQERAGFVWVVTAVAAIIAFGLVVLLLRVVFPSSGSSADNGSVPASGSTSSTDATGGSLAVSFIENPVLCSGTDRSIGRITGAQPGEIIEIRMVAAPTIGAATGADSGEAGMVGGPDRVADINGEYVIRWSCPAADAGRSWEVEATGRISRRVVGFLVTGTDVDPAGGDDLSVELLSDSFRCDGETRRLGTISGAEPGETIGFRSDQAEQIRSGTADQSGNLAINWNCDAEEASIIWTVIATGEQSGRSASFTFSGSTSDGTDGSVPTSSTASTSTSTTVATTEPDDLEITFTERPFRCDGQSRAFATLTGLTPGETVAFTSPDTGNLRSGEADGDGRLAIRWQCDGEDVGRSWRVTATGATSQRTITFTIDGAEPA